MKGLSNIFYKKEDSTYQVLRVWLHFRLVLVWQILPLFAVLNNNRFTFEQITVHQIQGGSCCTDI